MRVMKQKQKGPGGRPRKTELEKRSQSIRADLTVAEKDHVRLQAIRAGISEAEYTRRRVLGFEVTAVAARRSFDPSLVTEVNQAGVQLKAVGNLANQLALAVHTDRRFRSDWKRVRDEIQKAVGEVSAVLARVTGADGS